MGAVALAGTGLRQVQCIAPASAGCTHAKAVGRPTGIVLSRDGRTAYVRNGVGSLGSLGVFAVDPRTHRLRQIQCVARRVKGCADGRGLETPSAIAVTPDGANVYVTAANGRSVGIYRRAADGRLASAGSVGGLAHPLSVAVSPDGATVYVGGDRIWVYDRTRGGGLVVRQTIAAPARALAATSTALYAASHGAIVAYSPAGEELGRATSPALKWPSGVVVAGGFVYSVSLGSVARWTLSLEAAGSRGNLPVAFGLAVAGGRVHVAYRDGIAVLPPDLSSATTAKLAHATGVAAAPHAVYAVSAGRITAFAR